MSLSNLPRDRANSHLQLLGLQLHLAVEKDDRSPGYIAAVWKNDEPAMWFDLHGDTMGAAFTAATNLVHKKVATGELPELLDRERNFDAWALHAQCQETGMWYDAHKHKWTPLFAVVADVDTGDEDDGVWTLAGFSARAS